MNNLNPLNLVGSLADRAVREVNWAGRQVESAASTVASQVESAASTVANTVMTESDKAATTIQSIFRGQQSRQQFSDEERAATRAFLLRRPRTTRARKAGCDRLLHHFRLWIERALGAVAASKRFPNDRGPKKHEAVQCSEIVGAPLG